nr:hypothetical protein L204_00377 [Cryptococcus depauperatus CBS 7855]
MTQEVTFGNLPLSSSRLQSFLSQLSLSPSASAPRRSTIFPPSTPGVWARVTPMWAPWPIRVSKNEAKAMGLDADKGFEAEDILKVWETSKVYGTGENGLEIQTCKRRQMVEPVLLGLSERALNDSLPRLNIGDALEICETGVQFDLSNTAREAFIDILSGRKVLSSESYGPWSTRYSGHQFGAWAGQLGDGRAVSIIETENESGRWEVQLKGAGRTPFSRMGDGLATLRGGIREFLGSEAVAALGIPTTRALALFTTPLPTLPVFRDDGLHPASLLVRLAPSFIRIGHFEALNPPESLEGLRELGIWMKDIVMSMQDMSWDEWVEEVIKRNAEMVAKWQVFGFMNGVINTDNVTLLGITIDYGPYAFMDIYDDKHICNSSDTQGMYTYRNQPARIKFALSKFICSVSPLIGYDCLYGHIPKGYSEGKSEEEIKQWTKKGKEILAQWESKFEVWEETAEMAAWYARFGLKTEQQYDSRDIKFDFLTLLQNHHLDFHRSFRFLCEFSPLAATQKDHDKRKEYIKKFTNKLMQGCMAKLGSEDARQMLEGDFSKWLLVFAERAVLDSEREAWSRSSAASTWELSRKEAMFNNNPNFVLRPWILEETCAQIEGALISAYKEASSKDDLDWDKVKLGWKEARVKLHITLRANFSPFLLFYC